MAPKPLLKEKVSQTVDRIIYHPVNRGNGVALRSAFDAATGDIIVVQDADLEYNPDDYYSDNRRSRRCFQFPVSEWPTTSRTFLLAHGWQQNPEPSF